MIALKGISKIFRTGNIETMALDGIDLEIKEGEFVAVMGPSGCGKSTLLNLIGLLDYFQYGHYHFKGKSISTLNESAITGLRRNHIGFIFQSFNLIDELNIYDNIELPLIYQQYKPAQRRDKVTTMLEKMNLVHKASFYPQQLSGGAQQQVAIARALITDPALILADEPTGNLNSKNGEEIMDALVQRKNNGTTVIMATHSNFHASYCQRIINLLDGKIISENRRSQRQ